MRGSYRPLPYARPHGKRLEVGRLRGRVSAVDQVSGLRGVRRPRRLDLDTIDQQVAA
ncbi:hypothetical protein BH23ACT6_BH23ACT6_23670 [soil metagenome]